MPYGFMGKACEKYLSRVNAAMESANAVLSKNPFEGLSNAACPPPALSAPPGDHRLPYTPDSAMSGGYRTGVGNQSNIVVNQDTYEQALRKAHMIDAMAAEEFHGILGQIEEMCATVYIVPDTLPRLLAVTDKVKTSLEEFESLTDEAVMRTRKFVDEIMVLDGQ